jgi:prevent-host-death family protein
MKSVHASELQTNLDGVLSSAQKEQILISRGGKPCAVLVGVAGYDAEDLRLATSQDFWRMIRDRRSEGKSSSLAEVEARLQARSRKSTGNKLGTNKARKRS